MQEQTKKIEKEKVDKKRQIIQQVLPNRLSLLHSDSGHDIKTQVSASEQHCLHEEMFSEFWLP